LLREHRHHQLQSGVSNSIIEQPDRKHIVPTAEYAVPNRNARPESRNCVSYQSYGTSGGNDQVDGGLLTVVDQPDPLVSLIQSLAEISPIRASSGTPKTESEHPISNNAASTISASVPSNVTNCSPNQSPKAWQNCTQVCRPLTQILRVRTQQSYVFHNKHSPQASPFSCQLLVILD
jgi:hypothetical protein